ncbi:MAG TPA: DUF3866 family protein [Clostridiales bacterium]|nr:DUF3866 family protein [Clostridiales bacterium]
MLEYRMGRVTEILERRNGVTEVLLDIDHPVKKAINYDDITGSISKGDLLYLNTTAASLGLGTGGYHFVVINCSHKEHSMSPGGHGMKVRYTPFQVKVPYAEEEIQSAKELYNSKLNLKKKLICFGELHSMIPPLCAYFKYHCPRLRICYIMTDQGALPLKLSRNIDFLKKHNLVDSVITIGNAFGGDYECVNIYTGLQTAAWVDESDIILVSMGPGIVGTGTRYGFSGLEMGFYIDLAIRSGGQCCYIPRISFAEGRQRHFGLSHHSITMLTEIVQSSVLVTLPILQKKQIQIIYKQLHENKVLSRHRLCIADGSSIREVMEYYRLNITTMGRGIKDDPAFFLGIGAAAKKSLALFYRLDRL